MVDRERLFSWYKQHCERESAVFLSKIREWPRASTTEAIAPPHELQVQSESSITHRKKPVVSDLSPLLDRGTGKSRV